MTDVAVPDQARIIEPASQGTAIEQTRAAAEVAAAVSVARNFPRDQAAARAAMLEVCTRAAVAERAFYEVPNHGAGMSVHIARELARIWQNIDYGVRELRRDDVNGVSEVSVWAWDQEANVRSTRSIIVPHARMKGGRRQPIIDLTDIYLSNQNYGARAVRECIFTILPGWFIAEAEVALNQTLINGEGKTREERIADAVARFADIDVTVQQLEDRLGRTTGQWQPKDLGTLTRIHSSITIDGIKVTEFFPDKALDLSTLPSTEEVLVAEVKAAAAAAFTDQPELLEPTEGES
jgi:hypothetical protein